MQFSKYHALGNDYLVLDPADVAEMPDPRSIRLICHRNFGLGSDGILHGPLPSAKADTGLRIYNPDGSEAEKSGNGLRIFSRYLIDSGQMKKDVFTVETPGGVVECRIRPDGLITIEMGKVTFSAARIPVTGPDREVLNESIEIEGRAFTYCAASIGNPHCVLPVPRATADLAHRYGCAIECDPRFPRRTNVQFLEVVDRRTIRIEIWERGAGYTLASGSSSSAAGAVAKRLGLIDGDVSVLMPGGRIELHIDDAYNVRMTGPATRVAAMTLDPAAFDNPLVT